MRQATVFIFRGEIVSPFLLFVLGNCASVRHTGG